MGQIISSVVATVVEMRLEDKLLPWRNPSIGWFALWLPGFVGYMYLLMGHINAKPSIGSIEVYSAAAMSKLFYTGSAKQLQTSIEVIAGQNVWTEGPLWVHDESSSLSYLLYSDTVLNKIYRWEEGRGFFTVGKTIHLHGSGTRNATYAASMYEAGSNGLIGVHPRLLAKGAPSSSVDLLAAQHGDRAISLLRENGTRSLVASHYKGQRLNSPNDLVYSPEGHLYFTDPPYGLVRSSGGGAVAPELQELGFSGVYMISAGDLQQALESGQPTANVRLLHDGLSRPNGLAFSPDFSKLYVSNSDARHPVIVVFDVSSMSGALANARVFYDGSAAFSCAAGGAEVAGGAGGAEGGDAGAGVCDSAADSRVGVPDGLKVDIHGNVLASGPGGVLVLSPQGELLGRLRLPDKVSNLAFGADGRLYITASDKVLRLRVRTKSAPRGEQAGKK